MSNWLAPGQAASPPAPDALSAPAGALASGEAEEDSLLSWLQTVADQNVPETLAPAAVPVAWMGRTSNKDAQDPELSLPRQLEASRRCLPEGS